MNELTIGNYLINRLRGLGVEHVFGVPGDYVLGFYALLEKRAMRIVNTCDEQGAGFAADAYARVRGLGVVCVTYCVGGLKIANTTAEAFAEKSPVVIISGSPGLGEREKNPLLHHKVREFDTQLKIFEQITAASTVLIDAQTAQKEIDRVLDAALHFKRPVYIEIPRDMVNTPCIPYHQTVEHRTESNPDAMREALAEAVAMLNGARQPVILADVEIHRFALQEMLLELAGKANIPIASTILGKSVISEEHPLYLGVYEGAMGREDVRRYVEESDCVLLMGVFMTDVNLGIYTAHLELGRAIYATSEKLTIRFHTYENVGLRDFLAGLIDAPLARHETGAFPHPEAAVDFTPESGRKITVRRLFQCCNAFLTKEMVVIADVGDALFGAADLLIRHRTEFLGPAYYTSMGFAVPACIGAEVANPRLRPLVLVGDGAFQMTGMELSTAVRYGLSPIVIVLNNGGYGTERQMQEGAYNDILNWNYHRLPELLGAGRGFRVETEDELDAALIAAEQHTGSFCLLDVQLDPVDRSPALERLTERLSKRL